MEIDDTIMNDFINALYNLNKKTISTELNKTNVEFYAEGIVKSVNDINDKATVTTAFDDIENVPNLSGIKLSQGQKVKLFYNNRNMSGCYIGAAF